METGQNDGRWSSHVSWRSDQMAVEENTRAEIQIAPQIPPLERTPASRNAEASRAQSSHGQP